MSAAAQDAALAAMWAAADRRRIGWILGYLRKGIVHRDYRDDYAGLLPEDSHGATDPRALAILHEWVKTTGAEMNEARLRMTRIPKGADLIVNEVSGAPDFWIGNVIVMVGVPCMQAMLDEVAPKLKIGVRMLSETVRADAREGDIGMQLGEIAKANPEVAIGSYPFFDPQHGPNTNVVLRARDAQRLAQAKRAVEEMLERVRRAQSSS